MRMLAIIVALFMTMSAPVVACPGPGHFVKVRPPKAKPKSDKADKPPTTATPTDKDKPGAQKPAAAAKPKDTVKKSDTVSSK